MWSHSQTQGGFPPGPRDYLRESVITHSVRTLPSSTWRRARWVPSTRSCNLAGRYTDYGTLSFGVSGVPHAELL